MFTTSATSNEVTGPESIVFGTTKPSTKASAYKNVTKNIAYDTMPYRNEATLLMVVAACLVVGAERSLSAAMVSPLVDRDFQVFAGHNHRAVGGSVHAYDEGIQVVSKRGLPLLIEGRERLVDRAVIGLEYIQEV